MDIIYLDHAATTYLDPRVRAAMEPFWEEQYGNPSSGYSLGRHTAAAIKHARQQVADILGSTPAEIIFTAGGTESINLALFGVMQSAQTAPGAHIITSAIEHSAVLNSCDRLEQLGYQVTRLSVDSEGFVSLTDIEAAIRPETRLISIMAANNEIGTIEPIAEIGAWLKKVNADRAQRQLPRILFHTDACQAGGVLDLNVDKLGVDLLTLNGSKVYGPKQTGLLYCRSGIELRPILFGGGQECGIRSGTENVPGIVGLSTALHYAHTDRQQENKRLWELRNYLYDQIVSRIPAVRLNGPRETQFDADRLTRLPNNLHLSFSGVDGHALMLYLDQFGICVSLGSACMSNGEHSSHVLAAINCPIEFAGGSIRLSLGKRTTREQLDTAITKLVEGVQLFGGQSSI
jgi:cysteine desulfurase